MLRWPSALLVIASVLGCTTPSQQPPPPTSIASQTRGQDGAPAVMPDASNRTSQGGPGAPGSSQGYGAASINAAEVEEEEVAADGSTRLISSSRRAAQGEVAGQKAGAGAGGASGGAALPPSSTRLGGGGSNASTAAAAYHPAPDMEGVQVDEPDLAPQPSGDDLNAAPSSDVISGRRDDPANARLGVRGGRDEAGTTLGTPAASSLPPQAVSEMPVRENDILAQQLHEAATKEKDPVLRDKLWAEYRKYKAGL